MSNKPGLPAEFKGTDGRHVAFKPPACTCGIGVGIHKPNCLFLRWLVDKKLTPETNRGDASQADVNPA